MAERLPITAYAAANGLGRDLDEVVSALRLGTRGLSPCPLDVPFETVCGVVQGPLPALAESVRCHRSRLVQVALLGFEGIAEPVARARRRWGPDRIATIVSTSTGGIAETEEAYDHHARTGRLPDGYDFANQHNFAAFGDVLRDAARITGPRYVVSTACSSSGKVFASARRMIEADLVDAAVVGGVDTLCLTTVRGFHSLGVLAPEPCRPFGADRPGMNIGEGAAFALVERDGDPRGWLLGVGESSDAFHMSAPHPEGAGALLAMERALADAGLRPADIDHVNAHGTGTPANDVAEAAAIEKLFGTDVPVASTKGYTGHTLGAGGATEAVFALASLEQGFVPASVGAEERDPAVRVNVPVERLDMPLRTVLSNSFAFGGNNVALVLGRVD